MESNSTIEILSILAAVGGNYFFFRLGKCVMQWRASSVSNVSVCVDTMAECERSYLWIFFRFVMFVDKQGVVATFF